MNNTRTLAEKGALPDYPKWLPDNIQYETMMGSVAYGVSSDTSDVDIYGFVIPPKELIFPHLAGEIPGFGRQLKRFDQFQAQHIKDPEGTGREYDISLFSIVKFFSLAMENNPNMVDALFTPHTCVLQSTSIAQLVRENRLLFLHKGSWHKFKGYAYSQKSKMFTKTPTEGSNRRADYETYGFDVKAAYHCVRLMLQVEQILTEGDLDLMRHKEQLKAIRRGEWTAEQVNEFFSDKEKSLEELYVKSELRHSPDEGKIKALLVECLQRHYGDLKDAVHLVEKWEQCAREVKEVLSRYGL
jgi:uncharacterized protein